MGTKQFDNYADLITFTRASGATYLDSDGVLKTASTNTPRIEYDADGNRLGLLVEEQRTNIQVYSEDFANADWTKARASIDSNTIVAPDGTLTGSKLIESTDNNTHTLTDGTSVTSGTSYTYSIYAKAGERSICRIYTNLNQEAGTYGAFYDLSSGAVTSETGTGSATITPVSNSWYRITCTVTATASAARAFYLSIVQSGTTVSYAGDGTSGIYIWGAQLEAGSFPTSYIPTSGSTATRAADVASITGADFKKWFNADEGTLFAEASSFAVLDSLAYENGYIATITDGTDSSRIQILLREMTQAFAHGGFGALDNGTINSNTFYKLAFALETNSGALSLSGAVPTTASSGVMPVNMVDMTIGDRAASSTSNLCGHIKSIKYYPRRLSNAQLQELTQ
jgi:hypothetical protein